MYRQVKNLPRGHLRPARASLRFLRRGIPAALIAVLALPGLAHAGGGGGTTSGPGTAKQPATATIEACVTAAEQSERSVTFVGEMTAIPGTVRMEMRIDVLERAAREPSFHAVTSPGLGVWRSAASGVKDYKYLKQVTGLGAPAAYRAAIRFRWIGAKGHAIKALELITPRCVERVPPPSAPGSAGAASTAT